MVRALPAVPLLPSAIEGAVDLRGTCMEAAGLSEVRVGEASKPGPDEVECCIQSGSWILESIN
eukprot:8469804-Alexandrium_andersonii.AAC.1